MNFFEKWNKGRFSVYESEEKTALKLIENINNFIGKLSQGVDNKTDLYGDHKGSWQGLNRPTLSEEGMRATVENLQDNIIPAIENDLTSLSNIKIPAIENDLTSLSNIKIPAIENEINSLNLPHKTINKMINGERVTIVCYGDSITAGDGSTNGQNYPYFLQIILREYYNNNNINVINCGVGGRRTTEFLLDENLQTVYNNNPDLVIFMTAINDCNGSIFGDANDIETYKNNLISIYNKLKQYDLIFVTANDYISDKYNKTLRYKTYINTFKEVAKKYNICLVDMNKEFNNILKIENKTLLNALPDKIHPNSYYYKKISDIIFTFGLCSNRMVFENNEIISVMYPNFKYSAPSFIYTEGTDENYYKYNVVLKPSTTGKFYLYNDKQNTFINVNIITLNGPISKNAQIKINGKLYNLFSFNTIGISTVNYGNYGDYYKLDSGLNEISIINNETDIFTNNDLMSSGIKILQINESSKYIKNFSSMINTHADDVIIYKKYYDDTINTNKVKINFTCDGVEYGIGIGSNIIATGEEIPQFVLYKTMDNNVRIYYLNKTSTSEKISVGGFIDLSGSITNGNNTVEIIKNATSYTIKINGIENNIQRNVINFGKIDIWVYLVGKGGNNQMLINEIIGER